MKSLKLLVTILGVFAWTSIFGDTTDPRYNCTDTQNGYTWTYSIVDGMALIGATTDDGTARFCAAVTPEPSGLVTVPNFLGGHPVVAVSHYAFKDCSSISEIVLPSTVRFIGSMAFRQCSSLRQIKLPQGLQKIDSEAFSNCGITKLVLPASLNAIYYDSFAHCYQLAEFEVEDGNEYFAASGGVLYDKTMKTVIAWPITKEISIPNGVESIGNCACRDNDAMNGKTIEIPSSVKTIGEWAFYNSNCEAIKLNEGLENIASFAFGDLRSVRSIVIPSTVQSIADSVFSYCHCLRGVYFCGDSPATFVSPYVYCAAPSDLITYVRSGSKGWDGAGAEELPSKWPAPDESGYDADCRAIAEWTTYPSPLKYPKVTFSVGSYIYPEDWNMLEQVVNVGGAAQAPTIHTSAYTEFLGWDKDFSHVTEDMIVHAKYRMFDPMNMQTAWCDGGLEWGGGLYPEGGQYPAGSIWIYWVKGEAPEQFEIPLFVDNRQVVGYSPYAFSGCKGMKEAIIPDSDIALGSALCGCSSLSNIIVKGQQYVFKDGFLMNRTLDELFVSIGDDEELVLPSTVKRISTSLVSSDRVVKRLFIPSRLESIYGDFILRCADCEEIVVAEGNANFEFEDGVLYMKSEGVRRRAVLGLRNISSVELSETVDEICDYAFFNCGKLTSLTIPASVRYIGYRVLEGCYSLNSIYFKGNAPFIPMGGLFDGTPQSLIAYVRRGSTGWDENAEFVVPTTWPAQGESRPLVERLDVEPLTHRVTFDVGSLAVRVGGGELVQDVVGGETAVEPILDLQDGILFDGWDPSLGRVSSNMAVRAKFRRSGAKGDGLYEDEVDGRVWKYEIKNCEAIIVNKDEYGNFRYESAVEPKPSGDFTIPGTLGGCPVVEIGMCAIQDCNELEKVTVPDTVRKLGDNSFYSCISLSNIELPAGLVEIGAAVFCNCFNLRTINLPLCLKKIGYQAFTTAGLEYLKIPASVEEVGEAVFSSMNGPGFKLELDADNPYLVMDDGALYTSAKATLLFWPKNKKLDVPEGVIRIGENACSHNEASVDEKLVLPNTLRSIGRYAFGGSFLGEVVFNEGLEEIEDGAFQNENFKSIVLPSTFTKTGGAPFYGCNKLEAVFFVGCSPDNVNSSFYSGIPGKLTTFVRAEYKDSFGLIGETGRWPIAYGVVDEGRVKDAAIWATFPKKGWTVKFDLKQYGVRTGGGELEQMVIDGESATPPTFDLPDGIVFNGWDRDFDCVRCATLVSAVLADPSGIPLPRYYVSNSGSDESDGGTVRTAFSTLQRALDLAVDGDIVMVEDGVYSSISNRDDRHVFILSRHGATSTVIDAMQGGRCARLTDSDNNASTNVVLHGFTLCNGLSGGYGHEGAGAYGGRLENCIVSNCLVRTSQGCLWGFGGGVANADLFNCLLVYNGVEGLEQAYGGAASWSKLHNCTVVGNFVYSDMGDVCYGGTVFCDLSNTIVWGNLVNGGDDDSEYGGMSCFDDDDGDPGFVDVEQGDFRLIGYSPCIDAGDNDFVQGDLDLAGSPRIQNGRVDIGAYEGGVLMPTTPPENVVASENRAGEIKVEWDASKFADSYVIYRANRRTASSAVPVAETAKPLFIDTDVNPDYTYYYWVSATNACGESEWAGPVRGTCSSPIEILMESGDLVGSREHEEVEIPLEATGGIAPYAWSVSEPCFKVSRCASTFERVGKPFGWNSRGAEWGYELPFDFVAPDGYSGRFVRIGSRGDLEVRTAPFRAGDYDSIAWFEVSGGWEIVYLDAEEGIYVDEGGDYVTFRWQGRNADCVEEHIDVSLTICKDGTVAIKFGQQYAEQFGYGTSTEWIDIDIGEDCEDVVLEQKGLPAGMELTEDGVLVGSPVRAGAYSFDIVAESAHGGSTSKSFVMTVLPDANARPVIDERNPSDDIVRTLVGEPFTFKVSASDVDGDELTYKWIMDGELISEDGSSFNFDPEIGEDDERLHTLECVVEDDTWQGDQAPKCRWLVAVSRKICVDAKNGYSWPEEDEDPVPDGSAEFPYKSLDDAMCSSGMGDVFEVAPGTYRVDWVMDGAIVRATGGRDETIIEFDPEEGQMISGNYEVDTRIEGFTLRGVSVSDLTCINCVITGSKNDGAVHCILKNCLITGVEAYWCPVVESELYQCTVAGNVGGTCGGVIGCHVDESIVCGNKNENGEASNVLPPEMEIQNGSVSYFTRSCLDVARSGAGNVAVDPKFVDAFWGDYRLRDGSPVRGMGAVFLDVGVRGYVISTRLVGNGQITPRTAVVDENGAMTFSASPSLRPLVSVDYNGASLPVADSVTISNVTGDGLLTATFSNYTFYVDQKKGRDANDGLDESAPKKSIQSALDEALNGETILVAPGIYSPITGYGRKVRVVAVDGPEQTIIDGSVAGSSCASLGSRERGNDEPAAYGDWYGTNTVLSGFTLTGGHDLLGGGAIGGTLENCVVSNNVAVVYGGGVYGSNCRNCLIVCNRVEYDGNDYPVMYKVISKTKWGYESVYCIGGAGASNANLEYCTVSRNEIINETDVEEFGCGVFMSSCERSIFYGNFGDDCDSRCTCVDCVSTWDDDPLFADPDGGDFRLRFDSPYVVDGKAVVGCYETPYFDLPGTPQNVAASEDGPCVIYVTWDAAEFAEKYRVYRATREDFKVAECIAEVRECEFADRPADIIPEYYYWVQGVNGGGAGKVSGSAIGWCDIDKEPEEADNPVYEPSSEYYDGFCEWAVSNGLIEVESAAYPAQVRSAALALDAKGEPIWQDFIAGTDPSDEDSQFKVKIEIVNNEPVITWSPKLKPEDAALRKYTVWGKAKLSDAKWSEVPEGSEGDYNFYRVTVEMK